MPKVAADVPDKLKGYAAHGVELTGRTVGKEAVGVCPWCGKAKWYVNSTTGMWSCKVCGAKGNLATFLQKLYEAATATTQAEYEQLAHDRKLTRWETLPDWGVVKSPLSGDWLVPGWNYKYALTQLYRYVPLSREAKPVLLATPGASHAMHGVCQFNPECETVYLCEGPWDGMAWWEAIRSGKQTDRGLVLTGEASASVGAKASVLAVPGCNTFTYDWWRFFGGKEIVLMYDSDHPAKGPNGEPIEPAGYAGMRRVCGVLSTGEKLPVKASYLKWGANGYDKDRPSGFDLRDALGEAQTVKERLAATEGLLAKVTPTPPDWVKAGQAGKGKAGSLEPLTVPCSDWKTLVNSWRKAMTWPEAGTGLDHALACMLACAASTMSVGDQLWIKVIGPASCGKSTLCEAMTTSRKYVTAKSTIRGFHSGYREGKDEGEDNSLIQELNGKTLITKDGDTLIQSPNLGQILAEARDIYDRNARTHYRNKASKEYTKQSITWVLCGTSSLRALDKSELGERFLDCVIMEDIDEAVERDIQQRVAHTAFDNLTQSIEETKDGTNPDLELANGLTGGYVEYLRENAQALLTEVKQGSTEAAVTMCVDLAGFTARMRARPSEKQNESTEREFSARLTSQLIRLAACLAITLNRTTIDDPEVLARVKRVALDTARGRTLRISRTLFPTGRSGLQLAKLARECNETPDKARIILRYMRSINLVEEYQPEPGINQHNGRQVNYPPRFRLTVDFEKLFSQVTGMVLPVEEVDEYGLHG